MYETILVEKPGRIAWLWLNRPDVHNAFNAVMVHELRGALAAFRDDASVRAVVLSGRGRSFCSGADLNWMREIIRYSYAQNLQESTALSNFLHELYAFPKPTIARVNGTAIGGGTGFLAACDIVVADAGAQFGLSEVKIGLVPACIAPYIVRRTGEGRARRYFLTGERFDAKRAAEIGLVNDVTPPGGLDAKVDEIAALLLSSGPEALARCKELLTRVPGMDFAEAGPYTAEMIAQLRISPEGQEGMAAFLEKRKPRWTE
jgi:methylglutaconyl-CoA hydratase